MTREAFYDDDGEIIAATCVDKPLSDAARSALEEVIRLAREGMDDINKLKTTTEEQP